MTLTKVAVRVLQLLLPKSSRVELSIVCKTQDDWPIAIINICFLFNHSHSFLSILEVNEDLCIIIIWHVFHEKHTNLTIWWERELASLRKVSPICLCAANVKVSM